MITASFTDPQGTAHTDAVFFIRNAAFTRSVNERFQLDSTDFTTVINPAPNDKKNMLYSVYYWVSQTAKDNGAAPYILANSNEMNMDFTFSPDDSYAGLNIEQKCEKHLTEVVLPPMQV